MQTNMNTNQLLQYLLVNLWRFPIEGRPTRQQITDAITISGSPAGGPSLLKRFGCACPHGLNHPTEFCNACHEFQV